VSQTAAVQRPTRIAYIPALDGLRGLLVFPVALFHYSITAGWNPQKVFAPGSFFAPSTFFALSGFLITSLLLAEHERTGGIDGRGFWSRRFRRLLPASLLVIVAVAALGVLWPTSPYDLPATSVAGPLFSVANWQAIHWAATGQSWALLGPLGVFWSLSLEEQFYLGLFVVVLVASARATNLVRWLTGLLIAAGLVSIASMVIVQSSPQREFFGTDTRASELVAGCLLAVWIHQRGAPRSKWWSAVGLVSLAVAIAAWAFVRESDPWVLGGGLAAFSIVNIGLILGCLVAGPMTRLLQIAPLVQLGRLSYPVYLIHWPLVFFIVPNGTWFVGWPVIIVRFVVAVALAWMVFHFVERPLRASDLIRFPKGAAIWVAGAALALGLAAAHSGWR